MSDGAINYMYNKFVKLPADPKASFSGRTVLVTGANRGIGLQVCIKFAKLGASKIILGVRNVDAGNAAKASIESISRRNNICEVWPLDMDSYDSIKAFANSAKGLERLHIAILNAGVRKFTYQQSAYGWEETLQVNTLSTVLLALLLLPKLQLHSTSTEPAYLQFVTSTLHRYLQVTEDHSSAANIIESYSTQVSYDKENSFLGEGATQYSASKLFIMCAMKKITASAKQENHQVPVIVNAACPGYVNSGIGSEFSSNVIRWMMKSIVELFCMRSTEIGSRVLVSGVALGEQSHGKFWRHDAIERDTTSITGEKGKDLVDKVWHDILVSLSKDVPEVSEFAKVIA